MDKLCCLILFIIFFEGNPQAQGNLFSDERFEEQLSLYSKKNPENILFLHTDKTLYTNNEDIFFSGYLIKSAVAVNRHTILSTALIRDNDRIPCVEKKFDIRNGISFGSIYLPDTITPGNYHLIAYTNVVDNNKMPQALFIQAITIKSINEPAFKATLQLMDSLPSSEIIRAEIKVSLPDSKSKRKPEVTYSIGRQEYPKLDLDKGNNGIITLTRSDIQKAGVAPFLLVAVKYNDQRQYLRVSLPSYNTPEVKIHFFPEGGNLINNVESIVAFESKTGTDNPISIRGILYKNDQPIDTIFTNNYGIGKFRLRPGLQAKYQLHVIANAFLLNDTVINLPSIQPEGIVIRVDHAIVNDTLTFKAFAEKNTKVKVLIHNYREGFASFDLYARPEGSTAAVAISLVPKGLSVITIIDSVGRPLAERLFFAHFNNKVKVDISTDSTSYPTREKVSLHMKLTDIDGKPVKGIVSIACVQSNRIENSNRQDIEGYVYLTHMLSALPKSLVREMNSLDYLENVLLVKGWRRYSWQDMMSVTFRDTVKPYRNMTITGMVKYRGRKVKQPVELSFFTKLPGINILETDSVGRFKLTKEQLSAENGQVISLSVNAKDKERYTIEMDDPYPIINKTITGIIPLTNDETKQAVQTTGDYTLGGLQYALTLQEVIIKSKSSNTIYGKKPRGSNECGDFVTSFDYLNPPGYENAIGNHPPIKGERYIDGHHYRRLSDGATVVPSELHKNEEYGIILLMYNGCTTDIQTSFTKIGGIYSDGEFPGLTEGELNAPEPQWLSTLFCQPDIITDENGEAVYSFYTGDIKGSFRIITQGVGTKEVFYGEHTFNVH